LEQDGERAVRFGCIDYVVGLACRPPVGYTNSDSDNDYDYQDYGIEHPGETANIPMICFLCYFRHSFHLLHELQFIVDFFPKKRHNYKSLLP
jgi:hypothetical protein